MAIGIVVGAIASSVVLIAMPRLGHPIVVITGRSMLPAIPRGALVALEPLGAGGPAPTDVVTFSADNGTLVTHRVTRVVMEDGKRYIETRGDANKQPDPVLTPASRILGRVASFIPLGGYVIAAMSRPLGWLTLIALLVALWSCSGLLVELFDAPVTRKPGGADARIRAFTLGVVTRPATRKRALARATILVLASALLLPSISLAQMSATASLAGNTLTTPRTWYFLHNSPTPPTGNTAAVNNLTMTSTSSTQPTLYNYDTAADSLPGRRLLKSGTGAGDTTLTHYVNWQTATLLSALTINGSVVVRIWSGITGFPLGQQGVLVAYLRDYNATTSTYVEIANATLTDANWQQGSATWVQSRIAVSVSNYTLAIGHRLEVKLETTAAASNNMVVAYDTTAYPSSVGLP